MPGSLRSLYVCYLSLEDPLVETQVVAYLEGLARRGHTIHLLTFEPKLHAERRRHLESDLRRRGIEWHSLRYHKRPSLPATIVDALAGALFAVWLLRRHRLDAFHARNHVPAAAGLIVRFLTGCCLLFDIRGLMADEYVDAGRWPRGGIAQRITERIQRAAIARADGIVVLTERVRERIFGPSEGQKVTVIPCCADLDRLNDDPGGAERVLARLDLRGRPIMIYVGKLSEPYLDREMVEFFAVARALESRARLSRPHPGVACEHPLGVLARRHPRGGLPHHPCRAGGARGAPRSGRLRDRILSSRVFAHCHVSHEGRRIPRRRTARGVGTRDRGSSEILNGRRVGVVVDTFRVGDYERAAAQVRKLADDPDCRASCRTVARDLFSLQEVGIPRYDRLYRQLADADTARIGPSEAGRPS